jgi:ubiquinone/menaquinone biosynthesis C-methylase UbiE
MDRTAYTGFASVYDIFMDNIPYEEWCVYIQHRLKEYGIINGIVVDLACGTGNMTRLLEKAGYDMIGLDRSTEMLQVAREQVSEKTLLLAQDMTQMELYGTVAAFVCVCDGMNYLTQKEDLVNVFCHVNNYLEKGGIFIFDLKTRYFYETVLGNRVIAENRDSASFIWENEFEEKTGIHRSLLTIYQSERITEQGKRIDGTSAKEFGKMTQETIGEAEGNEALYHRREEYHIQRAYSLDDVIACIQKSGMEYVAAYDVQTQREPQKDSERIYIIARETYQKGKYYAEEGIHS